jgi:flagellar hook-length control protein FliK
VQAAQNDAALASASVPATVHAPPETRAGAEPDPLATATAVAPGLAHTPTAAATAPAVSTPEAAPPAPAPPPSEQLAAVIRPLPRGANGSYQVRIELRPPELGRVDLRVEMRDGVLHASIHTEHAHTADLVRSALDELRARLDADGLEAGRLTVDARGAGTSHDHHDAPAPARLDEPAPGDRTTAAPAAVTSASANREGNPDALLDVRI